MATFSPVYLAFYWEGSPYSISKIDVDIPHTGCKYSLSIDPNVPSNKSQTLKIFPDDPMPLWEKQVHSLSCTILQVKTIQLSANGQLIPLKNQLKLGTDEKYAIKITNQNNTLSAEITKK